MKKVLIIILGVLVLLFGCTFAYYMYGLTPMDKHNHDSIVFVVNSGDSKIDIVNHLKEQKLVKSKLSLYVYVMLNRHLNLQAGEYSLAQDMKPTDMLKKIGAGDIIEAENTKTVKFIEGKRITDYAKVIASNTNSSEEEVLAVLNDKDFIEEMIDKYWFLSDTILDSDIYYPLEGYLFASTYEVYADSSIKDIIVKMLDGMNNVLTPLKEDIEKSDLSIHEIMTMASIVELEGANSDDREGVAGVFYNRLAINDSLGSDVTTYYAVQKDFSQDLYQKELDNCNNKYNTRNGCNRGQLPIGPICSPSLASIKAALNPSEHDYYFFVADKNKKTYFMKTLSEHEAKVAELKASNLWYEY